MLLYRLLILYFFTGDGDHGDTQASAHTMCPTTGIDNHSIASDSKENANNSHSKENQPSLDFELKVVKNIPLSAKGRKRANCLSAMDEIDANIRPDSVRSKKRTHETPTTTDMLVDLTENNPVPIPVVNPISNNLHKIMEDLNGIDFSIGALPVPDLIPINRTQMSHAAHSCPGLSKGDVVKMILRRVQKENDPDDIGHLHYSSDSE